LCANSNVEYVAHVLPTHIFCLKLITQTQTIRGVAITSSDSVEDANSAFSPVEDTVDTNYLHELVESARDTAQQSIRGVAVTSDFVESANGAASSYDDDDCGQDPLYVDVEFPTGTSLKIVDQHSKCFKFHECEVSGDTIRNAGDCTNKPFPLVDTGEIICSFHVVFPGHSDGCDCTIKTTAGFKYHFSASDTCNDCFHIVGVYGSSGVPEGNVWPCGGDGCWSVPKVLVMVNPNH